MNAYGILGSLAIMACLAGWGSWEAGRIDKLQGQLDSRIAAEQTAAAQAKLDAAAEEKRQLDALNAQSSAAISQAQSEREQALKQLTVYQGKLVEASKAKDDGHRCAGVPIPADLLPGHQ